MPKKKIVPSEEETVLMSETLDEITNAEGNASAPDRELHAEESMISEETAEQMAETPLTDVDAVIEPPVASWENKAADSPVDATGNGAAESFFVPADESGNESVGTDAAEENVSPAQAFAKPEPLVLPVADASGADDHAAPAVLTDETPLPENSQSPAHTAESLVPPVGETSDSLKEEPAPPEIMAAADEIENSLGSMSNSKKSDRQLFFELKFNELDRHLTPDERQEWNSIYASYRGRSALSGTITGIDPLAISVRNAKTGKTERQTMFCASIVPYRVRIVIPESEMWDEGMERPDFVLKNMVGSTIDYIIIKVDRENGFAIASRRLALKARRYFFAHRPAMHGDGARVKCNMLVVGARRCLVECYGHDINLSQRELRYSAIPDLRNEYHPGQTLDCIVKQYDKETDKLKISVKETEPNPFDGAELRHPVGCRRQAVIAGKYGGGVFCNLSDGAVCMCNYSYQHDDSDFKIGASVIIVIQNYDVAKKQIYGKILAKW